MKKILIINGHPKGESFSTYICDTYKKGAEANHAEVTILNVRELTFEAFQTQFRAYDAPRDILNARQHILDSDHIVWVYPIWWYSMPAMLKAFIEQTFMSGFAFKYLESDKMLKWDKYLKGKTASVISTMDSPPWYYKILLRNPGGRSLKASMDFCGIRLKHYLYFGPVVLSSEEQRNRWIKKIEKFGFNNK